MKYKKTSYFYSMESFFPLELLYVVKKQILGIDKDFPFTISWYTHVPDWYNYFVSFIIK